MEKVQRIFSKFKEHLALPQPLPLYLRVWRMKCQRLTTESQKIAEQMFENYKIGLNILGKALQHCDTGTKPAVPQLLLQQYRSFKTNLQRSTRFAQQAMAVAVQATAMEHRLIRRINIPLEFDF